MAHPFHRVEFTQLGDPDPDQILAALLLAEVLDVISEVAILQSHMAESGTLAFALWTFY